MKHLPRYLTLILAVCLIPASSAFAGVDKDDEDKKEQTSVLLRTGDSDPEPGSCWAGLADEALDVNNVQVRLLNNGSVAYGNGFMGAYFVPQDAGHSPIYAMGLWIGGMVGSDLRVAGSRYGDFEFWPGPLGSDGRPVNPDDCIAYDRLYKVNQSDIQSYEATGQAAPDLADWPYDLGAPVIDGDGDEGNYDLAGGDRPDLIGDQAVWWIMNDVGNTHRSTESAPIGVEVRVHAFAFDRADALGNTTFFKYNVTYKGSEPLTDTFLSIFSDPDIGGEEGDFVGIDTTLGLGYAYHAHAVDAVYGPPPAVGYDFFKGPVSDHGDTLGVTSFMYFVNRISGGMTDPKLAQEVYYMQQGFWKGGESLTAHGSGFETDGEVVKFAYPGDPVTGQFWSEVNNDAAGGQNTPGDRRFVMSTGPFTMQPGDSEEVVFGILFAQGADNLDSITQLREADKFVQAFFDAGFVSSSMEPTSAERMTDDAFALEASLDDVGIAPNPYRGYSAYETAYTDRRVRFANMPRRATIRVYTVNGTLIRTLSKDGPSRSLDWDLTTDSNLPVASGMYFIHIAAPGVGERVMKFGVVNR